MEQMQQKVQALTNCDAKIMSMHTTTGQFKGQFKGVLASSQGQKACTPIEQCSSTL